MCKIQSLAHDMQEEYINIYGLIYLLIINKHMGMFC